MQAVSHAIPGYITIIIAGIIVNTPVADHFFFFAW